MDLHADGADRTLSLALRNIEEGKAAPCFLLYGEEEFLISEALDKIVNLLLPQDSRDLNLFVIDGAANTDYLCDTLLMPPLLPGRKVVLIKNTRLLHSRYTLPEMIRNIRERIDREPARAAEDFLQFLQLTGWRLDDFRDEGWKRITDDEWRKAVGTVTEGRETWLPRVVEFCASRGLDAGRMKGDDAERMGDLLTKGLPDFNHLILTSEAVDKRKKLFKVIAERGEVLFFPRLKGEARQRQVLMSTAGDLLAARGKKMTSAAWTALGEKTGFDLRSSMGALEKLMNYTGERESIEDKDVEEVIGKTKDDTVFDFTAALVGKDARKGLVVLKDLLDQGVNHLVILAMIIREIRFLIQAKLFIQSGKLSSYNSQVDYNRFQKNIYPALKDWMGTSGGDDGSALLPAQHPYVIYNALKNSERFTSGVLLRSLEDLLSIDIALKTSGRDPRLLLERFLVGFCA